MIPTEIAAHAVIGTCNGLQAYQSLKAKLKSKDDEQQQQRPAVLKRGKQLFRVSP